MFGNNFGRTSTPVTTNIIIINSLMLAATYVLGLKGIDLDRWFALHYFDADLYSPLQMITYMFMHANVEHLFFNMLSLFFIGRIIEMTWGPQRFLIYYLACGVGAAITQQLFWRYGFIGSWLSEIQLHDPSVTYGQLLEHGMATFNQLVTVGASGSVFGILLAFGMLYPEQHVYFYFVIPIKAKYFVIGYGLIELFAGVAGTTGDNIAHFAHLGGMIFGLLLILWWRKVNSEL